MNSTHSSSPKTVTASCSSSTKQILGGGSQISGVTNGSVAIYASHPVDAATDYFTASALEVISNPNSWTLSTYVICAG